MDINSTINPFTCAQGSLNPFTPEAASCSLKLTPFNMIIVGKTACGKTKYLLNVLEEKYKGNFEYIFNLSHICGE